MEKKIRKNDTCFIGNPSCGYIYESAKSCFLACPSDDKYNLKTEAIKNIIESHQYECYNAVKKINPGNFVFCTKICSKIIQSQFCIVLLDPSYDKKQAEPYPNPNVHFEYGMMLGQNKHVIPLQDENYDLAFDILHLDTIKYNDSNFELKVSEAITKAIIRANDENLSSPNPLGVEILTFFGVQGYSFTDTQNDFSKFIHSLGSSFGFFLFDSKQESKFIFFGPFDSEDPPKFILHTKLLIDNLVYAYHSFANIHSAYGGSANDYELDKQARLVKNICIKLVIPSFYDKKEVKAKLLGIVNKEFSNSVEILYRKDIIKFVDDEYNKIGILNVIKPD